MKKVKLTSALGNGVIRRCYKVICVTARAQIACWIANTHFAYVFCAAITTASHLLIASNKDFFPFSIDPF